MKNVFLLLGSNIGDRKFYLDEAIRYIEKEIAPLSVASSLYETQSWGITDAPDYINQVIILKTDISARSILNIVLNIEKTIGRRREHKWGPRVIDIDILFYDSSVINEENLIIPHPELHKRRFTLEPLDELVPEMMHPVLNKKINQLKKELLDDLSVKKII